MKIIKLKSELLNIIFLIHDRNAFGLKKLDKSGNVPNDEPSHLS